MSDAERQEKLAFTLATAGAWLLWLGFPAIVIGWLMNEPYFFGENASPWTLVAGIAAMIAGGIVLFVRGHILSRDR